MVRLSSDINIHNQMNHLLYRLIIFFDRVIWNENLWSEFTLNGLPIKYNWLWIQHRTIQWMQEQEVELLFWDNCLLSSQYMNKRSAIMILFWHICLLLYIEQQCNHHTILTNLFGTRNWNVDGTQQYETSWYYSDKNAKILFMYGTIDRPCIPEVYYSKKFITNLDRRNMTLKRTQYL